MEALQQNIVKGASPWRRSWRRLLKNKPAVAGMAFIIFSIFLGVFGYFITLDGSSDANDQVLQLETHPPGFATEMLKRRKNKVVPPAGWLTRLLAGQENPYELIPITGHRIEGSDIIIDAYRGKDLPTREERIPLADVVHALSTTEGDITQSGSEAYFKDIHEQPQMVGIEELRAQVEAHHLDSHRYLLGTDKFGRDVLSRLVLGVRVSLSVGMVAVFIALVIGIVLGAVAGCFRGWVDDAFMWLINVAWSIPTLLLVFALILAIGQSFWLIYVAVGLTMWVDMARIVRGQFLSVREQEFVEAAHSLGFSNFRTIFRHILPNISGAIIVIAAQVFATAILIEAGLSFLGIGVQPPKPSWGAILKEYYNYIGTDSGFLALFPALAIMLMVLAFNLVGNGLRDALDVKTTVES